jgi:hypothetical protein
VAPSENFWVSISVLFRFSSFCSASEIYNKIIINCFYSIKDWLLKTTLQKMLTVYLAVRVHIHHTFYENIPYVLKEKYCEKDKEINLHIANGTYFPCKI